MHSLDVQDRKLKRRGCEEDDFKHVLHLRGLGRLATTSCWLKASASAPGHPRCVPRARRAHGQASPPAQPAQGKQPCLEKSLGGKRS